MNHIALFTVIYPGSEVYFKDFNDCLKSQTRKDFDLVVVNDGCNVKANDIFQAGNVIELKGVSSVSKNREIGINYVIEKGYKHIVFCDIDDTFASERTEYVVQLLIENNNDIVVNDVNIIGPTRDIICPMYFSHSITSDIQIDLNFMLIKNILGFSNTALNLENLSYLHIPSDLRVVDWYLFTQLIDKGFKTKVTLEPLTGYRQYNNNMIGIDTFTPEQFKKMLKLKELHFRLLTKISDKFEPYWKQAKDDLQASNKDIEFSIVKNRELNPYPLWWENINIYKI